MFWQNHQYLQLTLVYILIHHDISWSLCICSLHFNSLCVVLSRKCIARIPERSHESIQELAENDAPASPRVGHISGIHFACHVSITLQVISSKCPCWKPATCHWGELHHKGAHPDHANPTGDMKGIPFEDVVGVVASTDVFGILKEKSFVRPVRDWDLLFRARLEEINLRHEIHRGQSQKHPIEKHVCPTAIPGSRDRWQIVVGLRRAKKQLAKLVQGGLGT